MQNAPPGKPNGKGGVPFIRRLKNRVIWSWAGWRDAWTNEPSFRSWGWANAVSALCAFLLPISASERLLIVILGILVMVVELMNTALERLADLVEPNHNEMIRRSKDAASAAVAVMALAAGTAWIWALVRLIYAAI